MRLTDTEREILVDLLVNGDNTPRNISENIGRAREHCSVRLADLDEKGLVRNKGGGVWTLTLSGAIAAREHV